MDGVMGGNDGGALAVAAAAAPGGGGEARERRGSMVMRVQMLDDSISLFQVQVRWDEWLSWMRVISSFVVSQTAYRSAY